MDDAPRIKEVAALQRFTPRLAEDCRCFRDVLAFEQVGVSSEALEQEIRQRSAMFAAARARWCARGRSVHHRIDSCIAILTLPMNQEPPRAKTWHSSERCGYES